MMQTQKLLFFSFCFFLFPLLSEIEGVQGSSHHRTHRGLYGFHPTKLFVFGDSYADTGNNRKTLANSWKVPYGSTFPGKPAGRFSDGRVLTDYLARFLGLKSPIPYKWRKFAANRLRNGMNFAYGGSGVFDTLVSYPNMTTQIDFLQNLLNDSSVYTTWDLQSSLGLVSLAGNDYSAFLAKGGSAQDMPSFISLVVDQLAMNLKRIHGMGVRKVAVTALQPLGCLPRSTVASSFQQCNATENTAGAFHNLLLQQAVAKLNNETKDSPFFILDLYASFISALMNKGDLLDSVKFETPLKPCCVGMSSKYYCGSVDEKGAKMYSVCNNPEAAFFWDMVHPTQAGWRAVYLSLKSTLQQIN